LTDLPPPALDDTQPRPALTLPPEEEPRGCANPLLVTLVALALIGMFVTMVALAAFAGYRDGGITRQTQKAVALDGTLNGQATLAWADLERGNFEVADARCKYVIEQQPQYSGMRNCISTAQAALNATPTFTPSAPPTATAVPPTATVPPQTDVTTDALFTLALEAINKQDYQAAKDYLEALRGKNGNFRRAEVEDNLVKVYLSLAAGYKGQARWAEMILVVRKAEQITNAPIQDWSLEATAAEYYLSAKSYLAAQNYALAAQVFREVMRIAPGYFSDGKALACEAFTRAGDAEALQTYGCS
jgi:tetratricopeptide (TPR) repeat protein